MNRTYLQQLTEVRVRDAAALLSAGQWSGAYYLAGYAVECGLKACVAKLTCQYDYPNRDLALRCYTHKIETLVEVAELERQRKSDTQANPVFGANWMIAKDWNETARYQQWSEPQARKLFAAVKDLTNGVLPWIMDHW